MTTKKPCIQFPVELLPHCAVVSLRLEKLAERRVFVLADTTYGSCCVDEKTAKHVNGDAIIHFGNSCLSATARTPVLYILTKPKVDLDHAVQTLNSSLDPKDDVLILFDTIYEQAAKDIWSRVRQTHPNMILSELVIPDMNMTSDGEENVKYGRRLPQTSVENILYIGSNERTILNFMLALPSSKFMIYDPNLKKAESRTYEISKLLMKRNYYIEKVKDCASIGILIGTLAVDKYLDMINQLKETLRQAGKRFYIVSIGEITPPKLANFSDIEVFVLVACPECSVIDSKEFFQPIVTPFEVELAFNKAREWTGGYVTDFRVLLPGGNSHIPLETDPNLQNADVSLITGEMRVLGTKWKGLDVTEEGSEEVLEGRSGVAEFYTDEPIKKQ